MLKSIFILVFSLIVLSSNAQSDSNEVKTLPAYKYRSIATVGASEFLNKSMGSNHLHNPFSFTASYCKYVYKNVGIELKFNNTFFYPIMTNTIKRIKPLNITDKVEALRFFVGPVLSFKLNKTFILDLKTGIGLGINKFDLIGYQTIVNDTISCKVFPQNQTSNNIVYSAGVRLRADIHKRIGLFFQSEIYGGVAIFSRNYRYDFYSGKSQSYNKTTIQNVASWNNELGVFVKIGK